MAEERFNLTYEGRIARGADPATTRARLRSMFKLTDKGAERLFTGKPVIVKRDVSAASAAQFKKIFAHAGAVLTITAVARDSDAGASPSRGRDGAALGDVSSVPLTLASGVGVLEDPPEIVGPEIDISYLSLVPGQDWTLEDCEPPPVPIPEPDLSYLTLEPLPDSEDPELQPDQLER